MTKRPITPPTRKDLLVFQGLQKAIVDKQAFVKVDFRKLNRFDSPFFNFWENAIPLCIVLVISLIVLLNMGIVFGTLTFLLGAMFYAFFMPYFLEPFMNNRVAQRIVPRIEKFLIAWRYGGISIVLSADNSYMCHAPKDDWRQFTEMYFLDLIPIDTATQEQK